MIPDQQILQGECQRMPHMQITCYIWRRHHDGERGFIRLWVACEMPAGQPLIVPARLDGLWVIGFRQNGVGHGLCWLERAVEIKNNDCMYDFTCKLATNLQVVFEDYLQICLAIMSW